MDEPLVLPKFKLILDGLSAEAAQALSDRPLPEELRQPGFRRMQAAVTKAGYDAAAHTVTMSVSSDTPIARYGGYEVLSHEAGAIDTSRLEAGIPYLFNHDWNAHLGRSQSFELKPHNLYVTNRFGTNPLAKEKEQDVADEILVDVSLAYWPLEVVVTEDKNGVCTYTLTKWFPYETSSVTVPADFTVGVGRSAAPPAEILVTFRKLDDTEAATRSSEDDDEDDEDGDDEEEEGEERQRSADPVTPPATIPTQPTEKRTPPAMDEVVKDNAADNATRITGLRQLRTQMPNNFTETQMMDAIVGTTTVEQARSAILDNVINAATSSNVRSAADSVVGKMSESEKRQYSRAGAARAAINQLRAGTFQDGEAGFAVEVSNDIRREATARGISGLGNGILTPGVTNARFAAMEAQKRTVMSGSGTIAGATNFTEVIVPPIELLRSKTVVLAVGARMIPGLHGTPQFTRQNAAASSSWLAEGVAATSSDPGLDFFQMTPHRLSMGSAYTRDFLALSNLAIDEFLSQDRNAVLSRSLDYACLAGSGTGNVPLGLLNRIGLGTVLSGATRAANGTVTAGAGGVPPTFIDLNQYEAGISTANGDIGTMAWVSTPRVRAAMRSIPQLPGSAVSGFLMPNSKVGANGIQEGPLGYNSLFSNQVPTNGSVNGVNNLHALILGVWDQLIIGDWDLSEVIADNITGAASATYKIWEHGYYDTNVMHQECFQAGYVLAS